MFTRGLSQKRLTTISRWYSRTTLKSTFTILIFLDKTGEGSLIGGGHPSLFLNNCIPLFTIVYYCFLLFTIFFYHCLPSFTLVSLKVHTPACLPDTKFFKDVPGGTEVWVAGCRSPCYGFYICTLI